MARPTSIHQRGESAVKGFVYEKVPWASDAAAPCGLRLDVRVRSRRGSRGICSGCGLRGPGYDTLDDRRFDFVLFPVGGGSRWC